MLIDIIFLPEGRSNCERQGRRTRSIADPFRAIIFSENYSTFLFLFPKKKRFCGFDTYVSKPNALRGVLQTACRSKITWSESQKSSCDHDIFVLDKLESLSLHFVEMRQTASPLSVKKTTAHSAIVFYFPKALISSFSLSYSSCNFCTSCSRR